jgi:hypothetical protein
LSRELAKQVLSQLSYTPTPIYILRQNLSIQEPLSQQVETLEGFHHTGRHAERLPRVIIELRTPRIGLASEGAP